jgi:hypothetical protein
MTLDFLYFIGFNTSIIAGLPFIVKPFLQFLCCIFTTYSDDEPESFSDYGYSVTGIPFIVKLFETVGGH